MKLVEYNKKRNFKSSPEPNNTTGASGKQLRFVIQRHNASRLHYDFRLEMNGVLKSWAVPKGPSLNPLDKRLAVEVEDHPFDYRSFKGVIPTGNYGAGIVEIFDEGTYVPYENKNGIANEKILRDGLKKGDLKIILKGKNISGAFALVRMKSETEKNWLLIKKKDDHSINKKYDIEKILPVKRVSEKIKEKFEKSKLAGTTIKKTVKQKAYKETKTVKKATKINSSDTGKIKKKIFEETANEIADPILTVFGEEPVKENQNIKISGGLVKLTNTNKIYWPKEKFTKGDLLEYYREVAPIILPYLKNRAHSLNRFPNGITKEGFYQKDVEPTNLPPFVKTVSIHSDSGNKNIDYLLCQNQASILYMVNLGCIELNPWNSRYTNLENPDWIVIDLDPGEIAFKEVVKTALVAKDIFDSLGLDCYCKTSGATGLHIYIPAHAKYNYDQTRTFAELVANFIHRQLPETTSVIRNPQKRKKQIYIDFLQNRRGQTIAAPYCVRPRPGATVSAPLDWSEVNNSLDPQHFTIHTMMDRISKKGDLWKPVLGKGLNLEKTVIFMEKL